MSSHSHLVPPRADRGRIALTRTELEEWGRSFGRAMQAPLVVAISGELGAGKTTLVQAICRGCGVEEDVTSPTFSLVHRYAAPGGHIYHLDLYRIERADELAGIGWDDILSEKVRVLVEWPERAGSRMPGDAVTIGLEHLGDDPDRRVLLAG